MIKRNTLMRFALMALAHMVLSFSVLQYHHHHNNAIIPAIVNELMFQGRLCHSHIDKAGIPERQSQNDDCSFHLQIWSLQKETTNELHNQTVGDAILPIISDLNKERPTVDISYDIRPFNLINELFCCFISKRCPPSF